MNFNRMGKNVLKFIPTCLNNQLSFLQMLTQRWGLLEELIEYDLFPYICTLLRRRDQVVTLSICNCQKKNLGIWI